MKRILFFFLVVICIASLYSCRNTSNSASDSNSGDDVINEENNGENQSNQHICTYDANITVFPPSCEADGYTLLTCTCGKTMKDKITKALGHSWSEWTADSAPSDANGGVLKKSCHCGQSETKEIPSLNLTDYKLEAIDGGEITARCDAPALVYYVYTHSFEENGIIGSKEFKFEGSYLPDHTYTDKYLYSSQAHYKQCDVCGGFSADTAEAHTMMRKGCYVCGFIASNVSYSEEDYGLSVSYNANEEEVIIPEFYCGADINHVGKKIKGIKSFGNNDNLRILTIPPSIEYIEPFAFDGCTSLEKIYYDGNIGDWCGISFGACSNPLNYASSFFTLNEQGNYSKVREINLPDTVSKISGSAFEGIKSISTLKIPKSIKLFGDNINAVFSEDTIIDKVFYDGDYDDWCNINFGAMLSNPMQFTNNFYMTNSNGEYYQPKELHFTENITEIGDYQFTGYKHLTKLSFASGLTKIGSYAFFGCPTLKQVDISNGCEEIGAYAFSKCTLLSTLLLAGNLKQVKDCSFEECLNLSSVYYPASLNDWCKIKFSTASSTPMHINKDRTYYSAVKFYHYSVNATEFSLLDAEVVKLCASIGKIGDYQFYGFNTISQIIIPSSVDELGEEAFAFCTNLTAIVIPADIKEIGENVINGIQGSLEIYYCGSPDGWTEINVAPNNTELNEAMRHYYAEDSKNLTASYSYWAYDTNGYIAKWYWDSFSEEWYLW